MKILTINLTDSEVTKGTKKDLNKTMKLMSEVGTEEFEFIIDSELDGNFTFSDKSDAKVISEILFDYNNNIMGLEMSEFLYLIMQVIKELGQEDNLLEYFSKFYEVTYEEILNLLTKDTRWYETAMCICSFNDEWQNIDLDSKKSLVDKIDKFEIHKLANTAEVNNCFEEATKKVESKTIISENILGLYIEDVLDAYLKFFHNAKVDDTIFNKFSYISENML